jgi:hypothetical protein
VGRLAKREQWPPAVLRRVFSSLLADVPRSLLAREVIHFHFLAILIIFLDTQLP